MYPHQLDRLTAALARHRAAALVGTTRANLAYLAGVRGPHDGADPTLAIAAAGGTALVLPVADTPTLADAGDAVDHVVPYGRSVFAFASDPGDAGRRVREWIAHTVASPGAALAAALTALGARDGAIALDDSGLTPAAARDLVATLGARTVVDGTAALLEARAVKGPWEIEAIERALGAAEEALNAVVQTLAAGTTEQEAVALFESEVRRRGATPSRARITFGARTALPAAEPSDRKLRSGELVRLDVGCLWDGYHGGVARTAVAGAPDSRQESVCDAVSRGLDAAFAAVRPGASGGDVFSAAIAAVRDAGLPDFDAEHVGHGVGLEARETPVLGPDTTASLEPGMVLRLEMPYAMHGWGGLHVTETILVARDGARVMNRSRRGLLVLD